MNALTDLSGACLPGVSAQGSENSRSHTFLFPGNMPVAIAQQTFTHQQRGSEFIWRSEYFRSAQPPPPPRKEGSESEFLASTHSFWRDRQKQLNADVSALKSSYVFRNEDAIARFLYTHRTAGIALLKALPQLQRHFGEDVVLSLEAIVEEDDSTSLYAVAVWRGQPEAAEAALEHFDESWWLNQPFVPGLTFTYELA